MPTEITTTNESTSTVNTHKLPVTKKDSPYSLGSRLRFLLEYFFGKDVPQGSICPSSPHIAQKLIEPLLNKPLKKFEILELGTGTGPITREILKTMNPDDKYLGIEANAYYAAFCDKIIQKSGKSDQAKIKCMRFEQFETKGKRYHFIADTLPYEVMDKKVVKNIFKKIDTLLTEDGVHVFIKIGIVSTIRKVVTYVTSFFGNKSYQKIQEIQQIKANYLKNKKVDCTRYWHFSDLFPTWVYQVRKG